MSNKIKGAARLVPYNPTKGERRHKSLVMNAKIHHGYIGKHVGSKTIAQLKKLAEIG